MNTPPPAIPAPIPLLSGQDFFETCTGFEEIAIANQFGHTPIALAERDPSMMSRAMVMVMFCRAGIDVITAKQYALGHTLRAIQAAFSDSDTPGDVIEDDPDSDAGKLGAVE